MEIDAESPDVTVVVSRDLLTGLGTWSEPVQIMIEKRGNQYTMIGRVPPEMNAEGEEGT